MIRVALVALSLIFPTPSFAAGYPEKGARIIGVVSVLPGEGKTTISKNLGSLLGFLGARTLLIDGDMRNPGLTRKVARHA